MKITGYQRGNGSHTDNRVWQFIEQLGGRLSHRDTPTDCDLAIQAGFQITPAMRDAMGRQIPIIILENPVWGKENGDYTWGYNGLNGLGYTPTPPMEERDHPELLPWKEWDSGQTTVFGQVDGDKALRGADISSWVQTVQGILPHSVFREHPVMVDARFHDVEPFEDVLARTSLAITYSSTVGAEAVIAGIPTIAIHEGSMAYAVSSHTLSDTPVTPDRSVWIRSLSWRHVTNREQIPITYIIGGYDEAKARAEKGLYDNMSNGRDQ